MQLLQLLFQQLGINFPIPGTGSGCPTPTIVTSPAPSSGTPSSGSISGTPSSAPSVSPVVAKPTIFIKQPSVAPSNPPSGGSTTSAPSIPTAVPAGFSRAFTEDFNTPAALGSFASVYGSAFGEYDGSVSTNGFTKYDSNKVLYVQNGSLYYKLHSESNQSYAAAPQPWSGKSFLYGQVGMSVRLDSSNGKGYKIAFLLWPATNQWTNEVDFPEVDPDFTSPIRAVSLITTTSGGAHNFAGPLNTGYSLSDNKYHTFLLTWQPGTMTASIDGKVVETFPSNAIPTQPMRLSLQAEGWINQGSVPTSTTDILEVPWVYINTYN